MEATPKQEKRYSFAEHPVIISFGIIAATATVFGILWSMHVAALTTRIEDLNSRLAERKDYEDRYHDEAVKRQQAETTNTATQAKLVEATHDLEVLRACKWQEQYETTKADLVAARESLRLLEAQHESMRRAFAEEKADLLTQIQNIKSGPLPSTFPAYEDLMNEHMKLKRAHLDLQSEYAECKDQRKRLADQLTVANSQIADLKKLVAAVPTASDNKDVIKAKCETLIASVQGLGDSYRVDVIAQGLRSIKGRFHVGYMLAMMNGMDIDSYKAKVVKAIAPYLIYPVDPKNMQVCRRSAKTGQ